MDYDNHIQALDSYLRSKFKLSDGSPCLPNDEWINIFANLNFRRIWENGKPVKEWGAEFSKIDWDETEKAQKAGIVSKHGYVHNEKEPISKYPFDKSHLLKIISLRDLDIGNPEMGEEVRINHIEPVKYLYNLKELSICNNTITSLKPVWNHPNLKRIRIENTLIPLEERNLFRNEHPHCELAEQVYL